MRQNVMDEGGHPYTHQSQSESRKWELYYYTPSTQFKITVKICNSVMFFHQMMNRCPFYGEFGGFARISRNLGFTDDVFLRYNFGQAAGEFPIGKLHLLKIKKGDSKSRLLDFHHSLFGFD